MRARLVLPLVGTGSPDVTIALSGQAVTASAGTISPAIAYSVSGSSTSTFAGTIGQGVSYGLSGQEATASAGTLAAAIAYALTGTEVAAQAGNVTAAASSTVVATNTGGWEYGDAGRWGWTREDYEAERARLIEQTTPSKKAAAVIQRVAKQAVERAKKVDGPPLLETLLKRKDAEAAQLQKALKRERIAYDAAFAQLLLIEAQWMVLEAQRTHELERRRIEAKRRQDEEEEQILALFMEM